MAIAVLLVAMTANDIQRVAAAGPNNATTAPSGTREADAERAELEVRIAELLGTPDAAGDDPVARMVADADALGDLEQRITWYLDRHPGDTARDRLILAKLEAIYLSCTLRGEGLARIDQELSRLKSSEQTDRIQETIDYWRLRQQLNLVRAQEALGQSDGTRSLQLMREFVGRHPDSPFAAPLIAKMVDELYASGRTAEIEPLLASLQLHHPRHVITSALVGRHRLHMMIGRRWEPSLTLPEGSPFKWSSVRGRPAFVVFWTPGDAPSMRMFRDLRSLQQRLGRDRFQVLAIALSRDASAVRAELTMTDSFERAASPGVAASMPATDSAPAEGMTEAKRAEMSMVSSDWSFTIETQVWRSPLVNEYGIRTLPFVVMIDAEGRLAGYFEPRRWESKADFERAALPFLGEPPTIPASDSLSVSTTQPASK